MVTTDSSVGFGLVNIIYTLKLKYKFHPFHAPIKFANILKNTRYNFRKILNDEFHLSC